MVKNQYKLTKYRKRKLRHQQFQCTFREHKHVFNKWLVNLTNINVPENEKQILSLGQNFNPPMLKIPYEHIIASIESSIYNCQDSERNEIRNKTVNIITNFKNKGNIKLNKNEYKLRKNVKLTKEFLSKNPTVLVTNAGKGNATVLIDKTEYTEKMELISSDKNTYTLLKRENTKHIQKEVNSIVEQWYAEQRITIFERNKLKTNNSVIGQIYGTPKIHKNCTPLRQIVSVIGTPTHVLSAFLCNILKNSIGLKNSSVKNAKHF